MQSQYRALHCSASRGNKNNNNGVSLVIWEDHTVYNVNTSRLNYTARQAGTRFTFPGGIEG